MENEKPRILVAIDFSRASEAALQHAIKLARWSRADLDLVNIVPIVPVDIGAAPAAYEAARASVDEIVGRTAAEGLTVRGWVRQGSIVHGIHALVDELAPLMVVVGSHGKGPLERMLVGSVANALVKHCPAPVVVVPAPGAAARGKIAWACADCGHMLEAGDSTRKCAGCGHTPVRWISAPVTGERADLGVPAVGDEQRDEIGAERANDPTAMFATSPAGTSGYSINPELRVRY